MKFLGFVLVLFSSAAAFAFLPTEKDFLPLECGSVSTTVQSTVQSADEVGITDVCVGYMGAINARKVFNAVSFRLTDGSEQIFHIVDSANILIAYKSGQTRSNFFLKNDEGLEAIMHLTRERVLIRSVEGAIGSLPYQVNDFEKTGWAQ
jgi:hypothetical protein